MEDVGSLRDQSSPIHLHPVPQAPNLVHTSRASYLRIWRGALCWIFGEDWIGPGGSQLLPWQQGLVPMHTFNHLFHNIVDLVPPAEEIWKGALGLSLEVCGTP